MSPILGIIDSQKSGHLVVPSDFELIETQTVGAGGASSIVLGNGGTIPQTYKHLQIRIIAKDSQAAGNVNNALLQFNGDTASNYTWHSLLGNGTSATSSAQTTTSIAWAFAVTDNQAGNASDFSASIIDILNYTSTSNKKTVRSLVGGDTNGNGIVGLTSGVWNVSPVAVTSITLSTGTTLRQHSTFSLYGMK